MSLARYQRVLAVRAARQAIILGILVRVPLFAGNVVLTLHVVSSLDRSYGQAGFVTAAVTGCIALSGPWRGRLLDRYGLRRVVLPSVVVTGACWAVAPFAGYWVLFGSAALAGLFAVPTFSIIRQAVITAVPDDDRRTALALDSVAVEISFMIGPAVGVWAATTWSTSWVLFSIEMVGVLAGISLWAVNPAMTAEEQPHGPVAHVPRRSWMGPRFVAVCAAAAAATIVLAGTDISIVAALRSFHDSSLIGPVLSVWGLGSLLGGLVYGLLHRPIPAFLLLAGLAAVTFPMAFAPSAWPLTVLAFVAGVLCAPTITATLDQLSRVVPGNVRGEALGWHGAAMTVGSGLGAPLAGVAIDWWGVGGGLVVVSTVGIVVAVLGTTISARRAAFAPAESPTPATATVG
ncbi:MAG TPA: MFS transporter [Jatrophihabitantaceae bacterium]|jgi:predicted MFS family arabinose efflux permease